MLNSFFSGLAGLNANSLYLSVIGSNLANVNTIGYKSDTVAFSDLINQTLRANGAGNMLQLGLGTGLSEISPSQIQGRLQTTGQALDVAIQGKGYLIVRGPDGNRYTRAGNLGLDPDGNLVIPEGSIVQGYTTRDPVTGSIVADGQIQDIVISPGMLFSPVATTNLQLRTNLDAVANPTDTYTSSLVIYDALGDSHVLNIVYTNTGPGAWNYSVEVDGGDIQGGVAGTPVVFAAGTLAFDGSGVLQTVDGAAPADVAINMGASQWANGAIQNTFNWDIVNLDGTFNLTGFASPSVTTSTVQDGLGAGGVEELFVDSEGLINGLLSNGQSVEIAQLALATFNNPNGLFRLGDNLVVDTPGSGQPSIGSPGSGGRGDIVGGSIEMSNVDIAQEFVNLITAQRGYQANARVITTSDEITIEAINLKR